VRELENCIQRLTLSKLSQPVEPHDLDLLDWDGIDQGTDQILPFKEAKQVVVGGFEQVYLEATLQRTNGNITRAADLGKKNRRAFLELMKKNHVDAIKFRPSAKKANE
jgi:DNA-binding NtrC family response regulator